MRAIAAMLLIAACWLQPAWSGEAARDNKALKALTVTGWVLLGEAFVGVNAGLAALDPTVYGVAGALLFPFGLANGGGSGSSDVAMWVDLAALETLAIGNIAIDKDAVSGRDVFIGNVIGWHLVAAVMGLTSYFTERSSKHDGLSLAVAPGYRGAGLALSYRF